ncbi:GGDEF domain-containing protein [Caminibacter mediatlanticus]|uniref:diguanylate cyclase n=1 Tax=Caminibacter mediatlanticus TB-2 TaxID=391592 RepID=A0AAI9AIA7_9BACT|nr:GGDEF domain-containing protein [Caminibacter mediatlanticus]EDM24163.1 diguanylate cyclase (GGDEF domain) [Caminibacter mediatlanticus TB-2]
MEELVKEISKETLKSLEKSGKLPFPLYYKEVFNKISYDKKIIDNFNPKLLCLNPSISERILMEVEDSIDVVSQTTKEIKNDSKEIIEEIDDIESDELKTLILDFSVNLMSKINKMEEKINSLQAELDKAYKELLIDPLTKVYNRKALEKDLNEILKNGKERDLDLVITIIDLDDFKLINDQFGHIVGDFVLIKICEIVKSLIRKTDKLYRYEGDEFIIVFNRSTILNAQRSIERIIDKISKTRLKYKENLIEVSVSAGLTSHKKGDTLESLIKRADEALYKVKNSTKNGYNII